MNKKSIAAIVLALILGASSYFLDGKDLDGAIKILTDKEAAKVYCGELLEGKDEVVVAPAVTQ